MVGVCLCVSMSEERGSERSRCGAELRRVKGTSQCRKQIERIHDLVIDREALYFYLGEKQLTFTFAKINFSVIISKN